MQYIIKRDEMEMARIRRDQYNRLRQLASRQGRTITAQLTMLLADALERAERAERGGDATTIQQTRE